MCKRTPEEIEVEKFFILEAGEIIERLSKSQIFLDATQKRLEVSIKIACCFLWPFLKMVDDETRNLMLDEFKRVALSWTRLFEEEVKKTGEFI